MHFRVVAMLPEHIEPESLHEHLERTMEPYNEDVKLPRHMALTRAELIARERRDLQRYRRSPVYAEYLADPGAYRAKHARNPRHLDYIERQFPALLAMDDDQLWQHAVRWCEPGMIDEHGNLHSTSNQQGYWDWWRIGGRYLGRLRLKPGAAPCEPIESMVREDLARHGELDRLPEDPALVNCARICDMPAESIAPPLEHIGLDGQWVRRGLDGCFLASEQEQEEYCARFLTDVARAPRRTWLISLDCHT